VIVPVSAHLVQLERADAVNRAIQRFLGPSPLEWRQKRDAIREMLARERPWLKNYEPGVPATIIAPLQPLHRFLGSAAIRYANRPATIFYGATLTWRQVDELANRFANALVGLGLEKGERIMLLLPNTPQMVICYYGALRAGAVVVPLNPLATEAEIEQAMIESGASVVVALSKVLDTVGAAAARVGIRHVILTNLKEYLPPLLRLTFTLTREASEGHRADLRTEPGTVWLQDVMRKQPTTRPAVAVSSSTPFPRRSAGWSTSSTTRRAVKVAQ